MRIFDKQILQKSRIYKVSLIDGSPVEQFLPANETRVAIMGHLFISEGKRENVANNLKSCLRIS